MSEMSHCGNDLKCNIFLFISSFPSEISKLSPAMRAGEDLTKEVRKLFLLTFPSRSFTHPQEACLQRQRGGI